MSHVANGRQMHRRFWVVGGKYESMAFDHLVEGTECVYGPFASEDDAKRTWRSVAERTRSEATVRFTIAAEPLAAPASDSTAHNREYAPPAAASSGSEAPW